MNRITLNEVTARKNWRWRMPEWVDETSRLYTGFVVKAATREWSQIVTTYENGTTTAYLTANGFDVAHHGPAINSAKGSTAQHRKVVREWFRDYCVTEVTIV